MLLRIAKSKRELQHVSRLLLDQCGKGIVNASVANEVMGTPRSSADYGQSLEISNYI